MTDNARAASDIHMILPAAAMPAGGETDVGDKAWNLIRMAAAGLPVPAGFVLATEWCRRRRAGQADDARLAATLAAGIEVLEEATGLRFGSPRCPLLVSVRSGAPVSMPGMLETVLDVGLNADAVDGLIRLTGNPRLAWDSWRRLVQSFAEVVRGLPVEPFERLVRAAVKQADLASERELDHRSLRQLTRNMLEEYQALAGEAFPQDPQEQLMRAAVAVFRSWDAPKAVAYRRLNSIDDALGTAVTMQTMVFGNAGGASGAGVCFTRNPATGERELYVDFQFNAQGEDVVSGRQTLTGHDRLQRRLPEVWEELTQVAHRLEALFRDAQDFEFTVQGGRLSILQTREAKRTPWAALRIAVDMVAEGAIAPREALTRLRGLEIEAVHRTRFAGDRPRALAKATVAGIGVVSGAVVLDTSTAERLSRDGTPVILVRAQPATEDIAGFARADGILTGGGGRTSHAAVVARQLGKVCLVGCPTLSIDLARRVCRVGDQVFAEGDFISLDGDEGAIYPGRIQIVTERPERELAAVSRWRQAAASAT
jgi:pyruvate, orthophosphate dikinase